MFEYLNSPAIFFGPAGVLSLYSTGKTTGVVLDIGDSGCQVTPIYEGLGLHHSILGSSIGGRRTTDVLQKVRTKKEQESTSSRT
jgi:actin-related protein